MQLKTDLHASQLYSFFGYLSSFLTGLLWVLLLLRNGLFSITPLILVLGCSLFVYMIPYESIPYRSLVGAIFGALIGIVSMSVLGIVVFSAEPGSHLWGPSASLMFFLMSSGLFIFCPAVIVGCLMGVVTGASKEIKKVVFALTGMVAFFCVTTIIHHVYVWKAFLATPDEIPAFQIFSAWSIAGSLVGGLIFILMVEMTDILLSNWVLNLLLVVNTILLFAVFLHQQRNVRIVNRISGTTPREAAASYVNSMPSDDTRLELIRIDSSEMPEEQISKGTGDETYFVVQKEENIVGHLTIRAVKYQKKKIGWSVKQYQSSKKNK